MRPTSRSGTDAAVAPPTESFAAAMRHVMLRFQGMGDNCEFGLVQRFCGIEPLGLFRFSSGSIDTIVDALDSDFRHYGSAGDLEVFVGHGDYLWCTSARYGFTYNTNHRAGTIAPDTLLESEYKRVGYLKRRLLEELAEGTKIFVRKGPSGETLDDVLRLAAAIRRHGSSIVLRVSQADTPAAIGHVRWHAPGILQGFVRRFSPYEGGMSIDLEPWVAVCRAAYGLATGGGRPAVEPGAASPIRLQGRAARHVTRRTGNRLSSFSVKSGFPGFVPGAIVVVSAWIWIPRDFRGIQIFGFIKISDTLQRLAHRDADLDIRDAWQRVWVSAMVPPNPSGPVLGLGAIADAAQHFWSTDWRIGEGPVPPPAPVPSTPISRGLIARFLG